MQRILIINPLWPHPAHSVRAANVVVYELVAAFAQQQGLSVGFLKINSGAPALRTTAEDKGIRDLSTLGVEFLEPFSYEPNAVLRPRLNRWFSPIESDFYPEVAYRPAAQNAAAKFDPDLIFIPWSETATSLFADMPIKKFAYYGNPDGKAGLARARFLREHGGSFSAYLRQRFLLKRLEGFHLSIMRRYDYLGDVAKNDANFYARNGHSNAFYIRNLWIDRVGTTWRSRRNSALRTDPFIIIGNIGQLGATANTYGLEILARDLLPELRRAMGNRHFEIHVIGAGKPHPAITDLLLEPEIRIRGFVDDIDDEIMRAPVFLCLNNASRYKVGHTRYLHAWSLGSCVVAHQDAALSMPEMISGENCLLGTSPSDIANMIAAVADDEQLRKRIGEQGYTTFRQLFTAKAVVEQVLSHISFSSSSRKSS